MIFTNPTFEKISTPHGGSILVRNFSYVPRDTRPYWHYHPELELVYVHGGNGKRHIGSHLSYFQEGELVLIGPNLPHQGFTNRLSGHSSETVVHWSADFLGPDFFDVPEMAPIKRMFELSRKGLVFTGKTKFEVGAKLERLYELNHFKQVTRLLEILNDLALSDEYVLLNAEGFSLEVEGQDNDRINKVFNHVREHFQELITLTEIADLVSMTEPSFCRYFKKLTSKTFIQFLNEYRLVHASKLLAEKKISITEVCYESGFGNFSHFNKQFKVFTGKTPSQYRSDLKEIIQ